VLKYEMMATAMLKFTRHVMNGLELRHLIQLFLTDPKIWTYLF